MPTISFVNGIRIVMYLRNKEHNPPHVHAIYSEYDASFYISNGEIYEGIFPKKEKALIKDFILKYKKELYKMWETGFYQKLP